jgi:signal transduction histidine kinase
MQNPSDNSNRVVDDALSPVAHTEAPLAQALLAALVDTSHDGVLAFDSELRVHVVNRQALHYLNLPGSPEYWSHRELAELAAALRTYAPEAVDHLRSELQRYREGDASPGEGEFRTAYGAIRCHNRSLAPGSPAPLQDASPGHLVILSHVTSQEGTSAECQDLMGRWMDGLQDPLRHVTEAMRYVAANSGEALPEALQQALVDALREADSTLATVCHLADFNRFEAGQIPLSMNAFALAEVVERVLEMEQPLARQKALKLERRIPGELPQVWGDKSLIERMLTHLVSGVIDAAPQGATISVEADVIRADRSEILVAISDRNVTSRGGVTKAEGMRLREPSPAYKRALTVRELSLAFCRRVVEAHGERFSVSHSHSAGLSVSFTLPQVSEALVSFGVTST